ncbi:OLC1v1022287C2 [Oldenlandia corymbosa var. corymbosa]|nr:OLC1v1022287C2 [Oldenlandia corymbosa var. corymbosa]
MASAGENLNASQFYITLRDDLDYLDGKHTVFGEVAEGHETLTRINEAYVDVKSRPYKNIRIKHTYILDDPFDDPPELSELIPDASPEGKPKDEVDDDVRLEDDWVPMDETLDTQQLEQVLREKEAHSRAVVLESIGDIPEAEIKPPDNVLFVCKLNPVTEDEDLHTIFSRFGTVTSADIIRDYKTGDSLCYAFIEFEDKEACEQAYHKMDNALIDDRRIHVDFSQSVAKLWSQYRRRGQGNKEKGCFKCGSLDHIAKDCTGDPTNSHQLGKYILKDGNGQHGNSSYDMVFDGDDLQGPKRSKMPRDQRDIENEKDKRRQVDGEERHTRKEANYRHRHDERSRDLRHQTRDRDSRLRDEGEDYRRKDYRGRDRSKKEDERYEKSRDRKDPDDLRHRNRRDERKDSDDLGHQIRRDERKDSDDLEHRNRRDERKHLDDLGGIRSRRDYKDSVREGHDDRSRHESRDEQNSRKRADIDCRNGRGEEQISGKRRMKEDDTTSRGRGDHDRDSRRRH